MHMLKEIQICQFSTTITHNDHFFPTLNSSLLINFTKLSKYALFWFTCIYPPSIYPWLVTPFYLFSFYINLAFNQYKTNRSAYTHQCIYIYRFFFKYIQRVFKNTSITIRTTDKGNNIITPCHIY